MARNLVRLHGGEVSAHSEGPGKGTEIATTPGQRTTGRARFRVVETLVPDVALLDLGLLLRTLRGMFGAQSTVLLGGALMGETTVVWGTKVSVAFKERVLEMAGKLGTKADYLMAVMAFETGRTFSPSQKNRANPTNGPVGLIQFTSVAATALGTSKAELVTMSDVEQLDYVEKHLLKKKDVGLSSRIDGVVVGRIMSVSNVAEPRVTFAGAPEEGFAARATTPVQAEDIGREVALMFESGDPQRPIMMGKIVSPVSTGLNEGEVDRRRVQITADEEIVLRCGESSITLTRAGKIILRGAYVLSRSSGVNRIQGGSVEIN